MQQRFIALGGLAAIVALAVVGLVAAGVIGGDSGGEGIEAVALLDTPPAAGTGREVGPQVGRVAPEFEISDFDGGRHRLSDFRGKAVYVNFWATWCVPCQAELPDIAELQSGHPDDLVVVVVNRGESLDSARAYFQNLPRLDGSSGVSFGVNGMDPDDTLFDAYRALGMPASFFIDTNGVVTQVYNGLLRLDDMEALVQQALDA
jgi:thiol-disulfide isomerase/thioredoxin